MRVTDFDKVSKLKEQRDSLKGQRRQAIDADRIEAYNIINALNGNIVCAAWSGNEESGGLFTVIRDALDNYFSTRLYEKSAALRELGVELDDEF